MWPIEKRCQRRDTAAFVAPETVDLLGQKMIGIIADRRVTKVHRYLGDRPGVPTVRTGLRLWHGGFDNATRLRSRVSAGVSLASHQHPFEGLGFSIGLDDETEQQVADRYHHPEKHWLGQRRDITYVELYGWPGGPGRDDRIRVEYWNEHGVGQETLLAFDDIEPIEELAWDVKGDKLRQVFLDDEFCDFHGLHFEHPDHTYGAECTRRKATTAENLRVLAVLAERGEQ